MNDRKMVLDGMMGLVVGDALGCHIASGLYYFIAKAIVTMAPKNADFITCIQCSLEKDFAGRSFSIKTGLLFRSPVFCNLLIFNSSSSALNSPISSSAARYCLKIFSLDFSMQDKYCGSFIILKSSILVGTFPCKAAFIR